MKISGRLVGTSVGPHVETIDARRLMAYAAALGDTGPEYLDTTRPGGVCAHPVFPVCYEWPVALMLREKTLSPEIATRSVHATHEARLHRRPRAGDRLSTTATIVAVELRRPGAYIVTRFETVDAEGGLVTTTDYGSIYRGVACEAAPFTSDRRDVGAKSCGAKDLDWSVTVPVPANLAHVYTECARIWNPIHTDKAVAIAAGLPAIILHGTATLALAVSEILRQAGVGADAPVTRIACRFGAMVELPSTLTVQGRSTAGSSGGRRIVFQALTPDGRAAVRDGCLMLDETARAERRQ
jgi:acyl dehydratase